MVWGTSFDSARGTELSEAMDSFGLVVLNDSIPTFMDQPGRLGKHLDLIFVSSHLACFSNFEVLSETYSSDHFMVVAKLDIGPKYVKTSSKTLKLARVSWSEFEKDMIPVSQNLTLELNEGEDPITIYL